MDTEANEVGRSAQGPVTPRPRTDWKRRALRAEMWVWGLAAAAFAEGAMLVVQAVKLGVGR